MGGSCGANFDQGQGRDFTWRRMDRPWGWPFCSWVAFHPCIERLQRKVTRRWSLIQCPQFNPTPDASSSHPCFEHLLSSYTSLSCEEVAAMPRRQGCWGGSWGSWGGEGVRGRLGQRRTGSWGGGGRTGKDGTGSSCPGFGWEVRRRGGGQALCHFFLSEFKTCFFWLKKAFWNVLSDCATAKGFRYST